MFFVGTPVGAQTAPGVIASGYVGGNDNDYGRDIAIGPDGSIYTTGGTQSSNFITTSGAFDRTFNGNTDVYLQRYAPDGTLLWSTFFGGVNYDRAYAIEVDSQGSVYIAGRAGSGFPTTSGALQRTFGGDTSPNGAYGTQDGFAAKFDSNGQLVWSTYIGSSWRDFVRDLDIDSAGNVYLAIADVAVNFPYITSGSFDTVRNGTDGVLAKLNPTGSSVVYAGYVGGSGTDGPAPSVRVNSAGEAHFLCDTNSTDAPTTTGAFDRTHNGLWDLYLVKVSASGASRLWATYYGGSSGENVETHQLALGPNDEVVIAGNTRSTNCPTTTGAVQRTFGGAATTTSGGKNTNYNGDAIVAMFSSSGALLAATYLGGSQGDGAEGLGVMPDGRVCVTGATYSSNFVITAGAIQTTKRGDADTFLVVLSPDFSTRVYSTFIGGTAVDYGRGLAVKDSIVFLTGETEGGGFPVNGPIQSTFGGVSDAFIIGFDFGAPMPPPPTVTNAPPAVQISCNNTSGVAPFSVLFVADVSDTDGSVVGYLWNFGDGATSTLPNPTHTFNSPGQYSVQVTITDDDGATATACMTLIVR